MKKNIIRLRNLFRKFTVFSVVFVALVNACFYCPEVQAADYVGFTTPYLRILFDNTVVVERGVPVSGATSSFQVVKTSSNTLYDGRDVISVNPDTGLGYSEDLTREVATFEGNMLVSLYFWNEGALADLFDAYYYIHFTNLNVYIPFQLIGVSGTGESVRSSSGVQNHLSDGVFDVPSVVTLPNGSLVHPSIVKRGTSAYFLSLSFVEFSYRSGDIINIYLPYTCSSITDYSSRFYENLDISVKPIFTVYDAPGASNDGFIRYTTGQAYSGRSTSDNLSNNVQDLVDGYDDSAGSQAASDLDNSASGYESAEDSIFTSSKSELDDFEFFDFNSIPAVVTGLSFITTTATAIFDAMGGASGAGIVLSVLFAVMFVSIVIGLYRYFK